MKICHLTSVHKANDVRIFLKECSSLAKIHEVYLVVVNGKEEIINNVKIISVASPYKNRFLRMSYTVWLVYQNAKKIDADIYHFHDSELLPIGLLLKWKGKKVIYDSHEDLPKQILEKHWIPFSIRKIISFVAERMEKFVAKRMSAIVTATPFIKNRFLKINSNTVDINNFPITDELAIAPLAFSEKKNEICYIGGIFKTRGILELLDALEFSNVKLHLAGIYSPSEIREDLIKKKTWCKVIEWGFVDRKKIADILKNSKIGIVTLHPTKSYVDSLPIKMFEYMASGIPVIASNFPYWKSIVEKNQCGICVNPLNPKEISDAINYLLSNDKIAEEMGKNGRKAVEEKYNWNIEEKKLIALYSKL